MLGSLDRLLGNNKEALAEYSRALEIWNVRNDVRRKAETLDSLGTVAGTLGDKERARKLLAESMELRKGLGDKIGEASVLNRLGGLSQSEDPGVALGYFNQS